jgi:hypothetical protein
MIGDTAGLIHPLWKRNGMAILQKLRNTFSRKRE